MKLLRSLYLRRRAFAAGWAVVLLLVGGYLWWPLFTVGKLALLVLVLALLADLWLLYRSPSGMQATRRTLERWSNGDENPVSILLRSGYPMPVQVRVLDELPVQFQRRDLVFEGALAPWGARTFDHTVRPVERGVYRYGAVNVFVRTALGLAERRFVLDRDREIAVYPAYLELRKYELLAISDRLTLAGIKRVRRVAQHAEFERVRDYVQGDDRRTVNWKATARRGRLMVNQYQDEKAQQVVSLIDLGRVMKMPFRGLSLLDHAINASLVLSSIAMHKEDKAGLITFSDTVRDVLPPSRQRVQMRRILETLYAQDTDHRETDMEAVYGAVRRQLSQRSLLMLYSNFESLGALRRQLPYLQRLARHHLVVVVFFLNTELDDDLKERAGDLGDVYRGTIARKYVHEKRLIVRELERHGLIALLVRPEQLTVRVINEYLRIKARGLI